MLRAILNKSGEEHPTKEKLYGHQLPILKTTKLDEQNMWDTAQEEYNNIV